MGDQFTSILSKIIIFVHSILQFHHPIQWGDLAKKERKSKKLRKKKWRWFIFSPSKMHPIQQHQTLPRVSGYQRGGKVSYGSVTSFLFILIMKMVLNTRNCSLFAVALEGASYFHIGHLLAWLAHLMNHLHNCIKYVILKRHKRYKNYIKWY